MRFQPTDTAVFSHLPPLGLWSGQEVHEARVQTCWPDWQENAKSCNNCGSKKWMYILAVLLYNLWSFKTEAIKSIKLVYVCHVFEFTPCPPPCLQHLAIACHWSQRAAVIGDVIQVYSGSHGRTIIFCETKKEANELALNASIKQVFQGSRLTFSVVALALVPTLSGNRSR